jgi:hypothetical protein
VTTLRSSRGSHEEDGNVRSEANRRDLLRRFQDERSERILGCLTDHVVSGLPGFEHLQGKDEFTDRLISRVESYVVPLDPG